MFFTVVGWYVGSVIFSFMLISFVGVCDFKYGELKRKTFNVGEIIGYVFQTPVTAVPFFNLILPIFCFFIIVKPLIMNYIVKLWNNSTLNKYWIKIKNIEFKGEE